MVLDATGPLRTTIMLIRPTMKWRSTPPTLWRHWLRNLDLTFANRSCSTHNGFLHTVYSSWHELCNYVQRRRTFSVIGWFYSRPWLIRSDWPFESPGRLRWWRLHLVTACLIVLIYIAGWTNEICKWVFMRRSNYSKYNSVSPPSGE